MAHDVTDPAAVRREAMEEAARIVEGCARNGRSLPFEMTAAIREAAARPAEATGDAERVVELLTCSKFGRTAAVPLANSVVPAWIETLSLQQQSVVLLALRGPDGVRKYHPAKVVTIAYRGTLLRAAERQRFLYWGEAADTFMSMEVIADEAQWREAIKTFFAHVDELPHHYVTHLAHAAQIIACHHPHEAMRQRWGWFYSKWCDDLHVSPESSEAMDRRLDDWGMASARLVFAPATSLPDDRGTGADSPMAPPPGLLMSIAMRLDHRLGVPGYYDGALFSASGISHVQRLEIALLDAKRAWEEVVGHGFYRSDREAEYVEIRDLGLDVEKRRAAIRALATRDTASAPAEPAAGRDGGGGE